MSEGYKGNDYPEHDLLMFCIRPIFKPFVKNKPVACDTSHKRNGINIHKFVIIVQYRGAFN